MVVIDVIGCPVQRFVDRAAKQHGKDSVWLGVDLVLVKREDYQGIVREVRFL